MNYRDQSRSRSSSFALSSGIMTLLVGLSGWLSPTAAAQSYLYNRADFPTGKGPAAVVAADFNGDGKLDLAVANQTDNTLSILLGKPDGTFATHVDYATGTAPVALVAADFNGDGKVDLAVVNSSANTISILVGNGDGTFAGHVDYSTGSNPRGLVAADFNGDKKIDLAVVNQNDNTVSILIGNGDGTFQAQTTVVVDRNPVEIASGDFNDDGRPDLITSNNNNLQPDGEGSVSVLLGKGDGTFIRRDSAAGYEPGTMTVGDFNNDGNLDVVVVDLVTSMSVLLGKGDGTFQSALASAPTRFVAPSILAADINHDGKLDLVAGGDGPATVLLGNGDGTFQPPRVFAYVFGNILVSADFNGDGLLDVLFVSSSSSVSVLLGNGDATFRTGSDYDLLPVSGSTGVNPGPEIVADFDGDGKPDVAVFESDSPTSSISVLLGKGDGSFQSVRSSTMTAQGVLAMVTGDFNGDGKTDVVASTVISGFRYISVLLGKGDGTFQASMDEPSPPNNGTPSLVAGDFNGDGKLDLAVTTSDSSGNESIQILLAQGNGHFQPGALYAVKGFLSYSPMIVGDFNRDGKLDLAAGNGEIIAVLIGNGDGTFQNPVYYDCGHLYIGALAQGDFNGDGITDLAVSTYDGVSVIPGNGDGTFRSHIDSNFAGIGALIVGDFNGDRKEDLANANSIAIGNGDGTFQAPRFLVLTPSAAAATDFNADGITDLVLVTQDFSATPSVSAMLSAPYPAFYPSPVSFGSQAVGVASPDKEITLTNVGNAPMLISGVAANGDFAQNNNCGSSLAARSNCTVSVTFTPSGTGTRTGALTFTDNAVTSPQVIALSGTGTGPIASLSAPSLTFSSQNVGSSSSGQPITLSNKGDAALAITSIAASGDFAQTNTCGSSVAAGASCTITVTFAPTAVGARTGSLTVTDNAAGSPQTVALTGTGTGPVASLSPSSVNFSAQIVNTTSGVQTVTLQNTGTAALNITGISASGDFVAGNNCGASVAANASCSINVTFKPAAGGNRTGTLTIADNAAGSPQTVALAGTGQDFSFGAASGGSTSASVSPGAAATYTLSVGALGGLNQSISFSCTGAPSESTCTVTPASVTPGAAASNVTVTVTTTAASIVAPPAGSDHGGGNWRILPFALIGLVGVWGLLLLFRGGAHIAGLAMSAIFPGRRHGKIPHVCSARRWSGVAIAALLLGALMMSACGGGGGGGTSGGGNPGTPAGSYTLTVAATVTSGSTILTHDVSLTLNVQ